MIWDRERYIAHCNFEFTGREMFCELFGLLIGLEEEWQRQGASAKEIALTAFDWDYVLKAPLAGNCEAITGLTPRVLEETPEFTVSVEAKRYDPTADGISRQNNGRLAEGQALV